MLTFLSSTVDIVSGENRWIEMGRKTPGLQINMISLKILDFKKKMPLENIFLLKLVALK